MAVYGYYTKRDLLRYGQQLCGILCGFVVAAIVWCFTGGSAFNLILGIGGVLLFSAYTAYDMKYLRALYAQSQWNAHSEDVAAIFGALQLYLDFVNLFISLLRIFGGARK
jgi:FtsH-binding integral membrane protein